VSVEVTRLANGLTVATDSMTDIGTTAVSVTFGAGARSEADAEHGLAHCLEHMAFKGTGTRSAKEIAETIEQVGGDLNAATGIESTSYDARVLAEHVPLALDILGDILMDPSFDETELEREKGVILQEIGAVEDTPDDLVYELLQGVAFSGQALGRPILGTPDSVSALSRTALVDFRTSHYRGSNGVVAAAGAVRHDDVVAQAETLFGSLPGASGRAPPSAQWTGGDRRLVRDLEQAHVVLAWPGQPLGAPDALALQIFAGVLGGGMSSRLFQEVREKRGLVYTVHAFHWAFSDTGLFGVYAGTAEEDLDELMPAMLDELASATATITEREVERSKAQARMAMELVREQPGARADRLARQIFIFGRPLPADEVLERLARITLDDVHRAGAAALAAMPAIAAVGPVGALWDIDRVRSRLGARDAHAA